jgi:putative hydrolase of the HAD superfamily
MLMKRALIFDLDNTIYPVSSIGEKLFAPLFRLIEESGNEKLDAIKRDVMRKPFQWVASAYKLPEELTAKAIELLKSLEYEGPIDPFADFALVRKLQLDKFLVTTGFTKMQRSKITALQLTDFRKTYIVDPTFMKETKKDIFLSIMTEFQLTPNEIVIIGDDPDSEIKAGTELGATTVLYDRHNQFKNVKCDYHVTNYHQLLASDFLQR